MIYGTKEFKNGKQVGYLEFETGKRVKLTEAETKELNQKIMLWKWEAVETERANILSHYADSH